MTRFDEFGKPFYNPLFSADLTDLEKPKFSYCKWCGKAIRWVQRDSLFEKGKKYWKPLEVGTGIEKKHSCNPKDQIRKEIKDLERRDSSRKYKIKRT